MNRPLVSVIIPVYNGEKYLRAAIDSALAQTYKPVEVIVVNDGSTDNSLAVLEEYGSKIRVVDQQNKGQAVARNRGIAETRGEFIAFLDCDDLWDSEKTTAQAQVLQTHPDAVAVYCDHRVINSNGQVTGRSGATENPRWSGQILSHILQACCIISPSMVMVRRAAFDGAGGFDETQPFWTEDWDLWVRLAIEGPILYQLETLASYRRHGKNASGCLFEMAEGHLHALLNSIAPRIKQLKNDKVQESFKQAVYTTGCSAGWNHMRRGERRQAISCYRSAVRARPSALPIWLKLGVLWVVPGRMLRTIWQSLYAGRKRTGPETWLPPFFE